MALLPLTFRPLRRIALVQAYLSVLLQNVRSGNYLQISPTSFYDTPRFVVCAMELTAAPTDPAVSFVPLTLYEEVSLLFSLYEFLVKLAVPFPNAKDSNTIVENLYDEITQGNGILGLCDQPQMEAFVDTLYRGTMQTFRSKKMLRRLVYATHCVGSDDECTLAVRSYLEKDKKDAVGEWWRRSSLHMGTETLKDVVAIMLLASRLSLESFGQSQSALVYAEKALELCRADDDRALPSPPTDIPGLTASCGRLFTPLAHQYLGSAYAQLALEGLIFLFAF
jgi:hypothetical protein